MRKKLLSATILFAMLFIAGILFSEESPHTIAGKSSRILAVFTVNSTVDTTDVNPGDGTCMTSAGECTLRAAIQEANASSGTDTIMLPTGVYTLTISGENEDASATGDLDITESVDIVGAGSATTIVDGNGLDRVVHIMNSRVSMTGMTIRNGASTSPGGGIHATGAPSTLSHVTLDEVTISSNSAQGNILGGGGGIFNTGRLTVTNSTISNNHAIGSDGLGGGIINNSWGPITSIDEPWLVIDNTVIANNIADSIGGGVSVWCASVLISNSTIDNNRAADDVMGGGVVQSCNQGKMRIIATTISNNRAGGGAGISHSGQQLDVINSTISGNNAIIGTASAIYGSDQVTLKNATIAHNLAIQGGALWGSTFALANTIIAFNGPANCDTGTFNTQGHNLSSDFSCSLFLQTDMQGVDPDLEDLADNGGATFTHALLPDSPAIDAGNPSTPGSGNNACENTDQRGQARPVDGDGDGQPTCDIGAYEYLVPKIYLPLIIRH